MKKRHNPLLVHVVFGFLLSIGCNNDQNKGKVQLAVIGENSSTLSAMMALEKEYEQQENSIDVKYFPSSFDDALEKSSQDLSSGKGQYDIILQYNFTLSPSVRNNYVYDISELTNGVSKEKMKFEADIFPNLWQETGYYYKNDLDPSAGTKMVSYPYLGISMVLMYNKTLFNDRANREAYQNKFGKSLAVPSSWDDYLQVAEFFTNKEKGTYGVCIEGQAGPLLISEWTNYLYGFNGKYLDKNIGWKGTEQTKLLINSPEAINALTYYKKLKPFNSGGYSGIGQPEQMQIMMQGKTAMAIVWTDMLYSTLKTKDGFVTDYGFAPVPGGKSIACGGAYFINRKSKYPQKAAEFIINQLQPSNQVKLARLGLCSPLKSAYSDSIVQNIPYTKALFQSLQRGGAALEAGPDADLITNTVSTYIQKVWNDEFTPSDGLSRAQRELTAARSRRFEDLKIAAKK